MKRVLAILVVCFILIGCGNVGVRTDRQLIVLKNGSKLLGKIKSETDNMLLVSYANGTMEVSIHRDMISQIRDPSAGELAIDRIMSLKNKIASIREKNQVERYKKRLESRYQDELSSARRAKERSKDKITSEEAPGLDDIVDSAGAVEGKGEDLAFFAKASRLQFGMSEDDVLEALGSPDRREENRDQANAKTWIYEKQSIKCSVYIRNSKVEGWDFDTM